MFNLQLFCNAQQRSAPTHVKRARGKSCLDFSAFLTDIIRKLLVKDRVSDPDPQDPHVFALPGSGQKGKEMNEKIIIL